MTEHLIAIVLFNVPVILALLWLDNYRFHKMQKYLKTISEEASRINENRVTVFMQGRVEGDYYFIIVPWEKDGKLCFRALFPVPCEGVYEIQKLEGWERKCIKGDTITVDINLKEDLLSYVPRRKKEEKAHES